MQTVVDVAFASPTPLKRNPSLDLLVIKHGRSSSTPWYVPNPFHAHTMTTPLLALTCPKPVVCTLGAQLIAYAHAD